MFGDAAWRDNKMAKSAVHVRALTYCDIHMERLILDRRIRTSNMLKSLFQVALSPLLVHWVILTGSLIQLAFTPYNDRLRGIPLVA